MVRWQRLTLSFQLFQGAAAAYEHSIMFCDVRVYDALFEIRDIHNRCLIRFLPTHHENTWPDWRDHNLNSLSNPLERSLGIRERHCRLRFKVEMEDPTAEIDFVHVADSWKMGNAHGLFLLAPPGRCPYRCTWLPPIIVYR